MNNDLIKYNKKKQLNVKDSLVHKLKNFLSEKFNKSNIAVIRMQGVISAVNSKFSNNLSLESLRSSIDEAFTVKNLQAIVLQIDCPGGSPAQSELIYQYFRLKLKRTNVKIYCFIEDVAASGGLYLAYIADEVWATPSSIVGSIGVRASGFGFEEAISKIGIKRRIYAQGENKVILDPFLPENKNHIEIIHKIQKNIHNNFKDFVKTRRGNKLNGAETDLFSGEFWSGQDALDLGLIDKIGYMNNIIDQEFGKDINIKMINTEKSWFKRKFRLTTFIDYFFAKLHIIIQEQNLRSKLGL